MNPSEIPDHIEEVLALEIGLLEALESALDVEAQAIKNLDYATIDEIRSIKEQLDSDMRTVQAARSSLSGEIGDELRSKYRETARRVRAACDLNNQLLRVTLRTVEGLVCALTGADAKGYAKKNTYGRTNNVSAVLTSSIG